MRKDFASKYITELSKEAILVDHKKNNLRKIWNQLFMEMVQTAVVEMFDSQTYMKHCYEELEKS